MFDGNVIYEMNPVGEINVPQEDKKPNMNDDGKGKISIATGSSGSGVRYVECHVDSEFQTIQCELSAEQLFDMYKHGEYFVLKLIAELEIVPGTIVGEHLILHLNGYSTGIPTVIQEQLLFSDCKFNDYGDYKGLDNTIVAVQANGVITVKHISKDFT